MRVHRKEDRGFRTTESNDTIFDFYRSLSSNRETERERERERWNEGRQKAVTIVSNAFYGLTGIFQRETFGLLGQIIVLN